MEKTKIVLLATAIAVLAALVLVGAAFAQTSAPTQTPPAGGVPTGTYGYGYCPGPNGYVDGAPQNGYPCYGPQNGNAGQAGYGRCGMGGMMGGYYR